MTASAHGGRRGQPRGPARAGAGRRCAAPGRRVRHPAPAQRRPPVLLVQDVADETIVIDASGSVQFGNTLFEHVAMLMLDSVVLALMAQLDEAAVLMKRNHTNL